LFWPLLVIVPVTGPAATPGARLAGALSWRIVRLLVPAEVVAEPVPEPLLDQYANATPPPTTASATPLTAAILAFLPNLLMPNSFVNSRTTMFPGSRSSEMHANTARLWTSSPRGYVPLTPGTVFPRTGRRIHSE